MMSRIGWGVALGLMGCAAAAVADDRPPLPIRDPHTPGYVVATELPDGAVAPADHDGNFIIGPTHPVAPEMVVQPDVPHGKIYSFTMNSA
ncbi:MAG: hypothetical protein JF615_00705, partial [Asticcacaulis sp.]|nr:hypothetical protein [Asticcacaulis sp.]